MSEPYLAKYLHQKGAALGMPIMGNFELTPRCNFSCKMCYVHLSSQEAEKRGRELTMTEWLNIARCAKERGMVFLLLTGGEPFLRKDFVPLYIELCKMGFMISINSNGSLIDDNILECFHTYPPHRINITMYGANKETYERLCGVPAYKTVVDNIDKLISMGISVRLNVSLTPYNKKDLSSIYDFAKKRNLIVKATSYMNPPIRIDYQMQGTSMNRFCAEEAAEQMIIIDKLNFADVDFQRRMDAIRKKCNEPLEPYSGHMRCRAGKSTFWITWDGRMLPCGLFSDLGSDVRKNGFDQAWEKTKVFTERIILPTECGDCKKRNICMVCAAMCQSETGRFDRCPRYICTMMDEYLEQIKKTRLSFE